MRPLAKPTDENGNEYAAGGVFRLCISRVRNLDLRNRLRAIEANVATAENEYDTAAAAATLHNYPRSNNVAGTVTCVEMIKTYTGRMVAKSQPGRPVYDRLLSAPAGGRCPLCGLGHVSTLDHHLPKAHYPVLAVSPTNLVPSCTWCQDAKVESYPHSEEEQTLHPYFDDVDQERWLTATVRNTTPAAFEFFVAPPPNWNGNSLAARVRNHLKTFSLPKLFTANAADELTGIRHFLSDLHAKGGTNAVRGHLEAEAVSWEAAYTNSWQGAMYRAASASDWFCKGGFAGV